MNDRDDSYKENAYIVLAKEYKQRVDHSNVTKRALLKLIYVLESEEAMMPPKSPSRRHSLAGKTFDHLTQPFRLTQEDEKWLQNNHGDITSCIATNA